MIKMICLANSWRPGGRCVAGISVTTGNWIRPVPNAGAAIPERRTIIDGRHMLPLDIVTMELAKPKLSTRYQCENRVIEDWNFKIVGQADPKSLLPHCSKSATLLHSVGKVAYPAHLEKLGPTKWVSLELVRVTNPIFEKDPRKTNRWQVKFSLGRLGRIYCLGVTDPIITVRLNQGQKISKECLLTVSLTEPIELPRYEIPELCYKIVAAVIEM
jgi:hypothetical protein